METLVQNSGCLYVFPKDSFKASPSCVSKKDKVRKEVACILVADDHPYLIHGVETDLNKDPQIKITGTATSYDELLERAKELQPDVILLDLKMPGCEKYELKSFIALIRKATKCKVIVFSNETGWARIHKCLEAGAQAYIEKAIGIGRLAEFIHRILENEQLVIYTAEKIPDIQFSERQKQVLHYIADGRENREIARLLKIDLKTVQSYINEVRMKFEEAFSMHPVKPRTILLLASKLGFGSKIL